jgi:hypothetical protein
VLKGGEFGECRRTFCPKVIPCTFEECGRPAFDAWCNDITLLYQECEKRHVLPSEGGVLDQSSELMMWFKIIDGKLDEHRQKDSIHA